MKKYIIPICIAVFMLITSKSTYAVDVSAEYCCMIEAETQQTVYSKNGDKQHSMASTTKIMTAVIALEKCSLDEVVTVSRNASVQEGSSLYLKPNDKIKMGDLLYGLMLNSGNDAAVAVAEHISGDTVSFADEMNMKAAELGMKNTCFKNPNGLDEDGHYSTAHDMAILGAYAMKNEKFAEIVSTKSSSADIGGERLYFTNHNKLLKMYEYANGIKTGYTKKTGRCLVSSADINGMKFIICTLNAPDDWNDHIRLYEYAEKNYERRVLLQKDKFLKAMEINGFCINVHSGEDVFVTSKKNDIIEGKVRIFLDKSLALPVKRGDKAGRAELYCGGVKAGEFDVVCGEDTDLPKRSVWDKIKSFFGLK